MNCRRCSRLDGSREKELRTRLATTALEQLGDAARQRLETQEQLQVLLHVGRQPPARLPGHVWTWQCFGYVGSSHAARENALVKLCFAV